MYYKEKEAPADTPISLSEAKDHALVTHDRWDSLITEYIQGATEFAQDDSWRQLITAEYYVYFDGFPKVTDDNPKAAIYLPKPPLQTVDSFTYTDTSGNTQTLVLNTDYIVDTVSVVPKVLPVYNTEWPTDCRSYHQDVQLQITTGYGLTSASIPEPIRQAIRTLTSHFIDRRGIVSFVQGIVMSDIPKSYNDNMRKYRIRTKQLAPLMDFQ